ncbi:unnamed protein product, partial [Scytosiphon promiscuus]
GGRSGRSGRNGSLLHGRGDRGAVRDGGWQILRHEESASARGARVTDRESNSFRGPSAPIESPSGDVMSRESVPAGRPQQESGDAACAAQERPRESERKRLVTSGIAATAHAQSAVPSFGVRLRAAPTTAVEVATMVMTAAAAMEDVLGMSFMSEEAATGAAETAATEMEEASETAAVEEAAAAAVVKAGVEEAAVEKAVVNSAVCIQRMVRARQARKATAAAAELAAAVLIQRVQRGRIARRRVAQQRADFADMERCTAAGEALNAALEKALAIWAEREEEAATAAHAAVGIQRVQRGRRVRKMIAAAATAAVRIQVLFRGFLGRRRAARVAVGVIGAQAIVRGFLGRRRAARVA